MKLYTKICVVSKFSWIITIIPTCSHMGTTFRLVAGNSGPVYYWIFTWSCRRKTYHVSTMAAFRVYFPHVLLSSRPWGANEQISASGFVRHCTRTIQSQVSPLLLTMFFLQTECSQYCILAWIKFMFVPYLFVLQIM